LVKHLIFGTLLRQNPHGEERVAPEQAERQRGR